MRGGVRCCFEQCDFTAVFGATDNSLSRELAVGVLPQFIGTQGVELGLGLIEAAKGVEHVAHGDKLPGQLPIEARIGCRRGVVDFKVGAAAQINKIAAAYAPAFGQVRKEAGE